MFFFFVLHSSLIKNIAFSFFKFKKKFLPFPIQINNIDSLLSMTLDTTLIQINTAKYSRKNLAAIFFFLPIFLFLFYIVASQRIKRRKRCYAFQINIKRTIVIMAKMSQFQYFNFFKWTNLFSSWHLNKNQNDVHCTTKKKN